MHLPSVYTASQGTAHSVSVTQHKVNATKPLSPKSTLMAALPVIWIEDIISFFPLAVDHYTIAKH